MPSLGLLARVRQLIGCWLPGHWGSISSLQIAMVFIPHTRRDGITSMQVGIVKWALEASPIQHSG